MRGSQKNKNYKIEWTPNFAYAVGLITTDGCLSKDGRHLDFTSQDIQLVKTFRDCLKLTSVKIGKKRSGTSEKKYSRVQFSNIKLYRWLLRIGLTPNKSKTISALKIPKKHFFDFLRGHFDGDGSCYAYRDKRWKNSFMFYTIFNSASLTHLRWLRAKLKESLGINGHVSTSKNMWHLRYAKRESKILFPKMYYKENLPCLERKFKKLKSILETNRKNKPLRLNGRVL